MWGFKSLCASLVLSAIVFFAAMPSNSVKVLSQDVIGCGGFIKADVPLDLTQIKVKLLTSYGSVKYTSEPAPNGYYMIPVYEKGEYKIQIQPKSGWNFQPSNPVDLDLEACERNEDINFIFVGFQISGQVVSAGTEQGPSGITVALTSNNKELQTTETVEGKYSFNNVLAGHYVVRAQHPDYLFAKTEIAVDVKDNVVHVKDSPTIHGYSLSGSILNEGQPAKGISFIIKSDSNQKADIRGCTAGSPPHYDKPGALCYVTSDESGSFKFQSIPVGKYIIVPFHRGEKTIFDVTPSQLTVEIQHANQNIKQPFAVSGFGVHGEVRYSTKGKGINGAVVSVNGKEVAKTNSHGSYAIDAMKSGTYTLNVKAPSVYFEDVKVKIVPSEPQLPLIIPSRFDVCGKISLETKRTDISVSISEAETSKVVQQVAVNQDGIFCGEVRPGTYNIMPVMEKLSPSLTLTPASVKVTVADSPITSDLVRFSQFKATVSGEVRCLSLCGDLELILRSQTDSSIVSKQTVSSSLRSAAFVFEGILPGEYRISVGKLSWCWEDNSKSVVVTDADVSHVVLQQKGYRASVESSNTMTMHYTKQAVKEPKKNEKAKVVEQGELSIVKGANDVCLPSAGQYELSPSSCHVFEKSAYLFDTSSANTVIHVQAVRHKIILRLTSEEPSSDVLVKLRLGDDHTDLKMPPTTQVDGKHVSTMEREIDVSISTVKASVTSSHILFQQQTYEATVHPDECPAATLEMVGYKGVFVEGSIKPAITQLNIQLSNSNGKELAVQPTDKDGKYRFGPLPDNHVYVVTAEKPGYVLAKEDDNPYNFRAFKLAEVSVHVEETIGSNLPGVILSLSGNSYKSNNRTDENGHFSFIGLSPGRYYLKAILKEYEFSPASIEVEVEEGVTKEVKVIGKRVAYSCSGVVVNLNGKPVSQSVVIRAEGVQGEDCINTEESSQAEPSGYFRVRGLKPGCSYRFSLRILSVEEKSSYRISPENYLVEHTSLLISAISSTLTKIYVLCIYKPEKSFFFLMKDLFYQIQALSTQYNCGAIG
ncbi:hypothetical protein EB796_008789 [Bugula neritina]|uniref:Uncharacterized protein n=1 Tax=Bugula neritina TaxID=10212 RepID=A0A7J7K4N0_BUGNE|nr:hypothetical protein EB796_008789 [Bugula neritina]